MEELNTMDVWDIKGEDKSKEDLASDKRATIEKLLELEESENEMKAAKETVK
jgi:hypothetical protein